MSQTSKTLARKVAKTIHLRYLLFLPLGYHGRGRRWPLILFLHGAGERGDDLELVKKHGLPKLVEHQPDFPYIVVSPQCPADSWWSSLELAALLDEVEELYRIELDRIYVTGLSMGGFGTWQLAIDHPHRFAAIVPVCGWGNSHMAHRIAHLPVWAFHGTRDRLVPIEYTSAIVRKLRELGAKPRFTAYAGVKHDSWTRTYENPRLYKWLLQQKRSNP